MHVIITQQIAGALKAMKDIPDNLRARFDAMTPKDVGLALTLTEDEAMALTELVQWHIRSDDSGKATPETQPYADLIRLVDEAQFG